MRLSACLPALLLLAHPAAIEAAGIDHDSSLPRTSLSLDGPWTLTAGSTTQTVLVPINIPFVFDLSIWTKTFTFSLPTPPAVAYLQFDGIVNSGTVELNGAVLGTMNGFSQTRFDVSGILIPNGSNTLKVTLDDRLSNDTVPGGDVAALSTFLGPVANAAPVAWANRPGIIRSVSLVYSPAPVITDAFVTQTYSADLSLATLAVSLVTSGQLSANTSFKAVLEYNGAAAGACTAAIDSSGILACPVSLKNPSLWSPGNPVRYKLSVALLDGGVTVDAGSDMVGLRRFEARGARFFLNGQPIFLRGISRHDYYNTNGFVADEQTVRADILQIKALGVNFIRAIHYPPTPMLAKIADEYGILISEELPAWANLQSVIVARIAGEMLTSLIARDYNRASVVAYNLGQQGSGPAPDAYIDALLPIAKQYDPSRLYSFVRDDGNYTADQIAASIAYAKAHRLDYFAQNTYWFAPIFAGVAPVLPSDIPFLSTEWSGAEGSDRGPLGTAATVIFPSLEQNALSFSEARMAGSTGTAAEAFIPYACGGTVIAKCVAGVTYFNWQDIEWPDMGYFYQNHYPWLRNGLVYEDRAPKLWPMAFFARAMAMLPQ